MNRRTFLERSGVALMASPLWGCAGSSALASAVGAGSGDPRLARIGITTVSIRSRFASTRTMQAEPTTASLLTLETAPEFIADQFGLHNVEVWDFHFDELSIAYCERVRQAAARVGSRISNIQIDRLSDLSSTDPSERERGVTLAREWVDRTVAIGAPSMRVNTGGGAGRVFDPNVTAESFRQITAYAAQRGITVLVENHTGFSMNIDNVVAILQRVNHPRCRALADYGNTPAGGINERVAGLGKLFPWLAFVSAKGTGFDADSHHSDYDFAALVRATEASGYRGIYSIEMWPDGDSPPPADPIRAATLMREAILENIRA